jgi:hypothetical protein
MIKEGLGEMWLKCKKTKFKTLRKIKTRCHVWTYWTWKSKWLLINCVCEQCATKYLLVLLASFCLDQITCVYRCCFIRDSTIQSDVRRFCTAFKTKVFGSLPAVRMNVPSRSDAHLTTVPSVRTTCHTVRMSVRPSIICPDDVHFLSGPLLYREATVPACIYPNVSAARPDTSQWSISFRFFPSSE